MTTTLSTLRLTEPGKINITPEDALLFLCTRQQFSREHAEAVLALTHDNTIDWSLVFSTARLHGVAPLVYHNLQPMSAAKIGLPDDIAQQFKFHLMQNMLAKEQLAKNVERGISFFRERSIDVMLVKGIALDALMYDQPWYTVTADADIVIRLKRAQVTGEQFQEFMDFFHRTAVEYDYFEHHDITMNGILGVDFDNIWHDASKIDYRGQAAFVMCPEDLLISVCINSCRKRFFRLKALVDIAEIINTYPDLNWASVIERAKQYDCLDIVYAALFITEMTLGCAVPETILEKLTTRSIKSGIIRWLSQRMSLTAFSSLYTEKRVLNRSFDWSLLLPYITLGWYQIWRKIKFATSHDFEGQRRS